VGGGRGALVGVAHAAGARLSNRWEVAAGAPSADPATAVASGADWLIPADRVYTSWAEMAEREGRRPDGIEAVVIATPNHSHKAIAAAFLENGIDVICDKPLTTTVEDALALVELQRRTGLVFGVTYCYASHAMARAWRTWMSPPDFRAIENPAAERAIFTTSARYRTLIFARRMLSSHHQNGHDDLRFAGAWRIADKPAIITELLLVG
jgi:hypothetical protein